MTLLFDGLPLNETVLCSSVIRPLVGVCTVPSPCITILPLAEVSKRLYVGESFRGIVRSILHREKDDGDKSG